MTLRRLEPPRRESLDSLADLSSRHQRHAAAFCPGGATLAERVAVGDPLAREHMVKANLRLVVNIARGYLGKGLNLEDLIEEGNLGLMRAVEGFDGMMETRFSTYASYWIKQSIRRAVMNTGKPIRLPAYMVSLLSKWRRATAVLTDRLGRAPTHEEVGKALRLSKKKMGIVAKAIRVNNLTPHSETSMTTVRRSIAS